MDQDNRLTSVQERIILRHRDRHKWASVRNVVDKTTLTQTTVPPSIRHAIIVRKGDISRKSVGQRRVTATRDVLTDGYGLLSPTTGTKGFFDAYNIKTQLGDVEQ